MDYLTDKFTLILTFQICFNAVYGMWTWRENSRNNRSWKDRTWSCFSYAIIWNEGDDFYFQICISLFNFFLNLGITFVRARKWTRPKGACPACVLPPSGFAVPLSFLVWSTCGFAFGLLCPHSCFHMEYSPHLAFKGLMRPFSLSLINIEIDLYWGI